MHSATLEGTGAPEDLDETARLIEKTSQRVVIARADVREAASLRTALDSGLAEFGKLDLETLRSSLRYPILIDGRNMYDPATVAAAGITYYSVGRPAAHPAREAVTA